MKTSKTKVTASAAPMDGGMPPKKAKRADPQPFRLQWWHYGLMLLGVVLAAFAIYGPALDGPFVLDDLYLPFMNPALANRPLQAWINVRPLLMLSFYANFKMHGTEPYYYHWLNVLIHAFNSILAYLIVRKMLDWVGEKGTRREILAAFAGAVFLTHPVQTESVSYVASRSEVLSIFFFLAAYAVFLYRKTEAIDWTRSIAVLVLFAIAASTKEHAVTLPLLLLLTDYWFNPGFRLDGIKRNWRLYGLVLAGGAFGVFAVLTVLRYSPSAGFNLRDLHWYEYLFTQFRSIWVYLRLFVLPVGQNLDYDFPISRTLFDQGAIFFLILLVGLAAAAWIYRRKFPLASFGFFGFLLLLAPTSSVIPIRDVLVEHRLYLPFICLLLATVDFLRRWRTPNVTLVVALSAVTLVLAGCTYERNQVWNNSIALWKDAADKSPGKVRPRFQVAYAYYAAGQCDESSRQYETASKLAKPDLELLVDWALALDCAGRPNEAIARLQQAATLEKTAHVYSLIGMESAKQGKVTDALEALAQAEKLDPAWMMTYVYRGNIFMSQNDAGKAIEQYQKALAIDPSSEVAKQALAQAQLKR